MISANFAYYNEIDPAAAHVLRHLISTNVIAPGDVDTRSIKEVSADDLKPYTQCHFFAGGGLWSIAARSAGWPDDRPLWTGSCPCQPFSAAGKGLGVNDPRHLWPDFFRLIRARRPPVVVGEQVAGAAGYGWFDGVQSDLESENYACRAVDIPACAVDAPHARQRLYWVTVGDAECEGLEGQRGNGDGGSRWTGEAGPAPQANGSWRNYRWIQGRRAEPSIRLLDHGIPNRVDLWRIGGNAIVPPLAKEVLASLMDVVGPAGLEPTTNQL